MGKSQFKIAADLVVEDCKENGYIYPTASDYYWAYKKFFEAAEVNFDIDKFNDYIIKRM
jgi:hypothetical protein